MYRSKLGTLVAILATAAGFSALAGTADAQISGSIGGDFVDNGVLTGTLHVVGGESARVDGYDGPGNLLRNVNRSR